MFLIRIILFRSVIVLIIKVLFTNVQEPMPQPRVSSNKSQPRKYICAFYAFLHPVGLQTKQKIELAPRWAKTNFSAPTFPINPNFADIVNLNGFAIQRFGTVDLLDPGVFYFPSPRFRGPRSSRFLKFPGVQISSRRAPTDHSME